MLQTMDPDHPLFLSLLLSVVLGVARLLHLQDEVTSLLLHKKLEVLLFLLVAVGYHQTETSAGADAVSVAGY